jgi:uncharacterized protein with HEPN domain
MRDDRERLRDILEAIERIENYVDRGEGAFRRDELIQTWMTRNIQVIGEAARGISQEFRDNYPEIPWSRIIGMRHVLVHEYFEIDLDIVWRVVSDDLPRLKSQIHAILQHVEGRTQD